MSLTTESWGAALLGEGEALLFVEDACESGLIFIITSCLSKGVRYCDYILFLLINQ